MQAVVVPALVLAFAAAAPGQTAGAFPFSIGVEIMRPPGCPVFITSVLPQSPAERAGFKPGDRVLAVDGDKVHDNAQAARLLRAGGPAKVNVKIRRGQTEYQSVIARENIIDIFARTGRKIVSGVVVPAGFSGTWISARVFPNGYSLDTAIFYPGFELLVVPDAGRGTVNGLVIRGRLAIVAGEIPPQGPAAKAGLQSGDAIAAVNGVPLQGQSVEELQQLFSSREPATIHLDVRRGVDPLAIDIPLQTATEVAAANGRRIVDGVAMPSWLVDGSSGCHPR